MKVINGIFLAFSPATFAIFLLKIGVFGKCPGSNCLSNGLNIGIEPFAR